METDNVKNNIDNDKALRKALQRPPEEMRYPSNFAFVTMQKVRQEKYRAERRRRRNERVVLAAVCVLSIGLGGYMMRDAFRSFTELDFGDVNMVSVVCAVVCVTFFAMLNGFLKKHFTDRRQ